MSSNEGRGGGRCERFPRSLLIISHVVHYQYRGETHAYVPYVRELRLWSDLFDRIVVAAPCRRAMPAPNTAPLERTNVSLHLVKETGGSTVVAKLAQVAAIPELIWTLHKAIKTVEAVQVRCPGNLGLLGLLLAPLMPRYKIAKYAGQWNGFPGEAITVRLQRAILRSRWWDGPVLVYGGTNAPSSKIVSTFTSAMSGEQLSRASVLAARKRTKLPPEVLFVGRLTKAKGVDVLLQALSLLPRDVGARCTIVGNGPEKNALERQVAELNLQGSVSFTGALEFDQVLEQYARADVLVLPSATEGWPKVVAEAMAHGLVCVASAGGFVEEMLSDGRGISIPFCDPVALRRVLDEYTTTPHKFDEMRRRAARWAQKFSLEGMQTALLESMRTHWHGL